METRICQNCKGTFVIEKEDFNFYKKIDVPPPTFCPECRLIRRLIWRNERALYKRKCDLCKKDIISIFDINAIFPVYCRECWWGDGWDPLRYGRDYDFSKPFLEQLKELFDSVPHLNLFNRNGINSDFANQIGESKNVYLSMSVIDGSENIFYSRTIDSSSNIFDCYDLKKSENCYENIDCERNFNSQYMLLSRNCMDSYFLFDCANCSHCFMCHNLRNKKFYIRNKKYSKEEYLKEMKKANLGSRKSRNEFLKEFEKLSREAIHRYVNNLKTLNSIGNDLENTKNCKFCFDVYDSENLKYSYRTYGMKDSMDIDFILGSELIYEYTSSGRQGYNIKFSQSIFNSASNVEYSSFCGDVKNIFGCHGLRSKENVILNKVYKKEEYEKMREKIIKHMNEMPYKGEKGRIYKYGEFLPVEISPHSYNETLALDLFPINEEEASQKGYRWYQFPKKIHTSTISFDSIPDNIKEVEETILKETLECAHQEKCDHQCLKAFRLTKDEFNFYKKHEIPIPDKCANCRYYERLAKTLPVKLWHRKCMCENDTHEHSSSGGKGCPNEFETPYAPDRPEIVYCEECYNKEVY